MSKVILHQPPPCWGLPNMSPFCAKLETYLRMAEIPYDVAPPNLLKAPTKKMPYISHNGKIIGDSGFIIDYLKKNYGDSLDANLSNEQKALGHILRRSIEEGSYFSVAWLRWTEEYSLTHVRSFFLSILPKFFGKMIFRKIRKNFLKAIWGQGTGRHAQADILKLMKDDIAVYSMILGDKQYFLGDQPSSIDAVMYGFLINILWVPWESPEKAYAKSFANLESYCLRMKKTYYKV